jgi:hypothetical protein
MDLEEMLCLMDRQYNVMQNKKSQTKPRSVNNTNTDGKTDEAAKSLVALKSHQAKLGRWTRTRQPHQRWCSQQQQGQGQLGRLQEGAYPRQVQRVGEDGHMPQVWRCWHIRANCTGSPASDPYPLNSSFVSKSTMSTTPKRPGYPSPSCTPPWNA